MSMSALSWHDDRSPRELARWAIAGAIVLGVHAGALIYLLAVHEPDIVGSNMDVVTVELAPINSTPDAVEQDLAPAPETMVESSPLPELPKPQEKPKEQVKLERPPDEAPAEVPLPVEKPPEKVREFAAARAGHRAASQGRGAEGGTVMADESDAAIAALQALPGVGAIAQGRRRRAVELQSRPLRPRARPQHCAQLRSRRSRRRSHGHDHARGAAAALPGDYAANADRSDCADPLLAALRAREDDRASSRGEAPSLLPPTTAA